MALGMQRNHVLSDKQLVISRTSSPGWLSIAGAIDYFNAESVAAALQHELQAGSNGAAELSDATTSNGHLHVDLSRLEFADTHGIKALVRVAVNAGPGQLLVLHGLPPLIRKVMLLVGWGDLPSLVIEDSR